MRTSDSINEIAKALSLAQGTIKAAEMNATNPFLHNHYADLGSIVSAVREPLVMNGLSFVQTVGNDGEKVSVTTRIMHESGQFIEDTLSVVAPVGDGMKQIQAIGAVITYLRRYSLSAMLGVYAEEDTDGEGTGKSAQTTVTTKIHAQIKKEESVILDPESLYDTVFQGAQTYTKKPTKEESEKMLSVVKARMEGLFGEKATEVLSKVAKHSHGDWSTLNAAWCSSLNRWLNTPNAQKEGLNAIAQGKDQDREPAQG